MNIGIVGGLDRNGWRFIEMASARGHEVRWHCGRIVGRGKETLEHLVDNSDLLIVQTDINSHTAVRQARAIARAHGKAARLVRRLGISTFAMLLDEAQAAEEGLARTGTHG